MSDNKTAHVHIDTNRIISPVSPLLFSGFAEHMGRCIYGGIYEPGSPHADENGLRRDVLAALRELNFRSIRYPGGNFLSGYRWEDGVGPRDQRPARRDLAWQSIETNQFGTDEFIDYCRAAGHGAHARRQHGHRQHPGRRQPRRILQRSLPVRSTPTCASPTGTPSPTA